MGEDGRDGGELGERKLLFAKIVMHSARGKEGKRELDVLLGEGRITQQDIEDARQLHNARAYLASVSRGYGSDPLVARNRGSVDYCLERGLISQEEVDGAKKRGREIAEARRKKPRVDYIRAGN